MASGSWGGRCLSLADYVRRRFLCFPDTRAGRKRSEEDNVKHWFSKIVTGEDAEKS